MRDNEKVKRKVIRGIVISIMLMVLAIAYVAVAIFYKQKGKDKMNVYEDTEKIITTERYIVNETDEPVIERTTSKIDETTFITEGTVVENGTSFKETQKTTLTIEESTTRVSNLIETISKDTTTEEQTIEQQTEIQTTEQQTMEQPTEQATKQKATTQRKTSKPEEPESHALPYQMEHNEMSLSVIEEARKQLYSKFGLKKSKNLQNAAIAVANEDYKRAIDALAELGGEGWRNKSWKSILVSLDVFTDDTEAEILKRIVDVVTRKVKVSDSDVGGIGFRVYKSGNLFKISVAVVY